LIGTTANFSSTGSFGGLFSATGGAQWPATGTATSSAGFNSSAQGLTASAFNSGTSTAVPQNFTWQAEPVGNNTASATGSLNLLFAAGSSTPAETGLQIASNGQITFAAGQSFPGLVSSVGAGDSSITIGGTASAPTVAVAAGGVSNAKLQNSSVTITTTPGSGLSGGGAVNLGGTLTLTNTGLLGLTASAPLASTGGQNPMLSLAAQYSKLRCEPGLGDGVNPMPAGTYFQSTCYNDSGVTWTITGIKCFTDDSGTSTLNATNGSGVGLLTGAITCNTSFLAGAQSSTTTIANGDYIKFTFMADGTSTQTTWVVSFMQ